MKEVKKILFPGVVLFVLFIPQSAFALSVTVTQGLRADSVSFEVENGSDNYRGYYFSVSEDWVGLSPRGFYYGWLSPGATGTVEVNFPITRGWPVGLHAAEIDVDYYEFIDSVYTHMGSYTVTVTLDVIAPVIPITPLSINATVTQGLTPLPQSFAVKNEGNIGDSSGEVPLYYSFSVDQGWMRLSTYGFDGHAQTRWLYPDETGTVQILFDNTRGWPEGVYMGMVKVASGATVREVPVSLTVVKPDIVVEPQNLTFPYQNTPNPYERTFTVETPGSQGTGVLYYSITEEQDETTEEIFDWMNINVRSQFERHAQTVWMDKDGTGRVTVNTYPFIYPKRLPDGVYTGKITIRTGSAEKVVPVRLRVGGCMPVASLKKGEVWPQNAGSKETTAKVKVELEQPAPPGGCTIELKVEAVPYSGWHSHDSRPDGKVGTLDNYEVEFLEGESEPQYVTYTSYEISGEENIYYREKREEGVTVETVGDTISVSGPEKWEDYVTIKVMVPELTALPKLRNLITYTSPEAAKYHDLDDSNYGTASTVWNILLAAKKYEKSFDLPLDANLTVIDISLRWGGLFDIHGNWSTPHDTHRKGTGVDFSKYYWNDSGTTKVEVPFFDDDGNVIISTDLISQRELDEYFAEKRCERKERDIGKIHYDCKK